ncbi:MAG: ATP-dependent helicase [candidate division Zixibacteria bacterium SM23_73_2]|nr:MAG: ATP-dependent helicase [candidate division Zixibacteria bacterium SM23_73_2]
MNLLQILDYFKKDPRIKRCISHWEVIPPRPAVYADFPLGLDKKVISILQKKGIKKLYSHQATAIENILSGKNVVVVTPTASGKTLCYNLPVLSEVLQKEGAKALYLFPTKALSQDQVAELYQLVNLLGEDIKTYTFDGDTPQAARKAIRESGDIVVTNPDMLHQGILPHHTKWLRLFQNLKFVVIDEIHNYRGVFGSHLGNVIRRLTRVCQFYGTSPRFVCCSATIANPEELTRKIIEDEIVLIDNNGAPSGEKHFIFYNPPVINKQLGIRRSYINEAERLSRIFIENDIQTIAFTRSRIKLEVLLSYLKEGLVKKKKSPEILSGYRGGYLPLERRKIERGLREGKILGVISTNALELGIDIGQLDSCVMAGYPGNIASTWQQAGRAGRRNDISVAVLIANSSPLDQYIINNPVYFFGNSPEHGIVDPDNLIILVSHIKCAAFELPFRDGEKFGVETTQKILGHLEENRILHHVEDRWHWTSEAYPADDVSLRSSSVENFVILDSTDENKVIGEVDYFSAPFLIHQDAIYLHEGNQFQIEKLDWEGKKAYAKEVEVDYFTEARTDTRVKVLDVSDQKKTHKGEIFWGEVLVTTKADLFKKIKFHTHENVGWGKIFLPEQEMETTSFWFEFPPDINLQLKMTPIELGGALRALSNVLSNMVPLWVMCDPKDIRSYPELKSTFNEKPTVFVYDNYPGGVGFSKKIFHLYQDLWEASKNLIEKCSCESGCPSCVGPVLEVGEKGKVNALDLLEWIL